MRWSDKNKEKRKEFTFADHWTKHKVALKQYQDFREDNWQLRQSITLKQWLDSLEIRKWQQFREKDWAKRERFELDVCIQHKDKVVRFAEWSEQDWVKRRNYTLEQWLKNEEQMVSFEAWQAE